MVAGSVQECSGPPDFTLVRVQHGYRSQACKSTILSASQQRLDLIVIAQERHEQIGWPVLKYKPQRYGSATLKEATAKFSNSKSAMYMRLAKTFSQLNQSAETFHSFRFRQPP